MDICLVTPDIAGATRNGGIGTAFYHLATTLAEAGHQVTVLYTLGEFVEESGKTIEQVIAQFAEKNIRFVPLTALEDVEGSGHIKLSWWAYQWLKEKAFDVIHFPDWRGTGYFSALAKHTGQAFANTKICIQLHSPTIWHMRSDNQPVDDLEQVETTYLESLAVRYADAVISPSQYLVDWYRAHGWQLPEDVQVIQNLLPSRDIAEPAQQPIKELVFFGRLEARKGVLIFCEAVRDLGIPITFLGKTSTIHGQPSMEVISDIMAEAKADWKVINDYNTHEAIAYLRGPGRLAVIASQVENSPYVVLEALHYRVPFIATNTGGTAELIAPEDREKVLYAFDADALRMKLEQVIAAGGIASAHVAIPSAATRDAWLMWHQNISIQPSKAHQIPLISVCIIGDNTGAQRQAVEQSTYRQYEVIEVPGGDYATALLQAKGDYALLLHPECIIAPDTLAAYIHAVSESGASVVAGMFNGNPYVHAMPFSLMQSPLHYRNILVKKGIALPRDAEGMLSEQLLMQREDAVLLPFMGFEYTGDGQELTITLPDFSPLTLYLQGIMQQYPYHATARIAALEQALDEVQTHYINLTNSRLLRWTAPLRTLLRRLVS